MTGRVTFSRVEKPIESTSRVTAKRKQWSRLGKSDGRVSFSHIDDAACLAFAILCSLAWNALLFGGSDVTTA